MLPPKLTSKVAYHPYNMKIASKESDQAAKQAKEVLKQRIESNSTIVFEDEKQAPIVNYADLAASIESAT